MNDFEARRLQLEAKYKELIDLRDTLFPTGAPITWRTVNSHAETGSVQGAQPNGYLRVVDGLGGFYCNITIDDILRATP